MHLTGIEVKLWPKTRRTYVRLLYTILILRDAWRRGGGGNEYSDRWVNICAESWVLPCLGNDSNSGANRYIEMRELEKNVSFSIFPHYPSPRCKFCPFPRIQPTFRSKNKRFQPLSCKFAPMCSTTPWNLARFKVLSRLNFKPDSARSNEF